MSWGGTHHARRSPFLSQHSPQTLWNMVTSSKSNLRTFVSTMGQTPPNTRHHNGYMLLSHSLVKLSQMLDMLRHGNRPAMSKQDTRHYGETCLAFAGRTCTSGDLPQISNRTPCPWRCYGDNSSSVVQNDDFLCAARLTDSIDKHLQKYATVSSSDCLCCCFVQPGISFSWAPPKWIKKLMV